jgi:hypothetical protein
MNILGRVVTLLILFMPVSLRSQDALKPIVAVWVKPEFNSLLLSSSVGKLDIKARPGLSAGLGISFPFSPGIAFRTGIGYGVRKYSYTHSGLVFSSDINPPPKPNTESRIETEISNREIQIPIAFQIMLKNPRFFIGFGSDIIYGFSVESDRTYYYGNGTTEKAKKLGFEQPWNIVPVVSFAYIAPIAERTTLSFEPLLKYYINPYVIPESHQYAYGLRISVNRGF